jgi:hypothetical protein
LSLATGSVDTIKLDRMRGGGTDAQIEVWLAPSLEWLPVRLRFTDRHQRVTESTLRAMETTP